MTRARTGNGAVSPERVLDGPPNRPDVPPPGAPSPGTTAAGAA
ncbi:hypothetical protein [Saccharothrix stipae]